MNATAVRSAALVVLALVMGHARAEGLTVSPDAMGWPRWQARLALTTAMAEPGVPQGMRFFSDYYFTGPGFGAGRVAGGLRATSGLLLGPRALSAGTPSFPFASFPVDKALNFTYAVRPGADTSVDTTSPAAYLGVGYTGVSPRGGWGFTADVGLAGHGLRLGRDSTGGSNLDDLLRDLRLTPMLQLGVSYSF